MKPIHSLLLATVIAADAELASTFDEAALPAAMMLDIPRPSLGNIAFDEVNDELDFSATGNTDMWTARNNAAIAWTSIPPGLVNGSTWVVETEVRLNNVVQNSQVAGLTFYGGPNGALPEITFGLDNWDAAARAVRLQGLGTNVPNVGVLTPSASVMLRVVVVEGGDIDTYNFFFRANPADAWTQLGGAATNYRTPFANTRVGLTYKTGAAKAGAAFTYFNVIDITSQPPSITAHPTDVTSLAGGIARFAVAATGAVSFQWRKNQVDLPGATGEILAVDPVVVADDGSVFDCVMTNTNGQVISHPAVLAVSAPPVGGAYYASAVQAEPSLLAYFPVEGGGSPEVTNVKNHFYGGVLAGTAALNSSPGRTVGTRSIASNGGGWVALGKDPEWNFADGTGTIELFVHATATATYNPTLFAVRNDASGGTRYSLHLDKAGNRLLFHNGTATQSWGLPSNAVGRLMHLVFVIGGNQVTLYHDGTSLGTVNIALGAATVAPAQIGAAGLAGQDAMLGNLDEVALYADPLSVAAVTAHYQAWLTRIAGTAPVVTTPPATQTVREGGVATFAVALRDPEGAIYRWQKNGVDLAGATESSVTVGPVTIADHDAPIRCVIYNRFGGALTDTAWLRVDDTTPPQLVSASSVVTPSQVILTFSEPIDISFNSPTFTVNGRPVAEAVAGPLPGMVTLFVAGLTPGQNGTVTVNNVADGSGNLLATASLDYQAAPSPTPAPIDLVRPGPEPAGPATRRGPYTVSEINYHPADRADGMNLEFIEIHNTQPWAEDLSGFGLTGEVSYTFPAATTIPAGGRLVVAAVPADVMSVHGLTGVLGPWTGSLNNSGGQVRLRDIANAVVFEVNYDAGSPWPASPDGSGHSLVLARPSFGMDDPQAWDSSAALDGSPGAAEPTVEDPFRAVMINEIGATAPPPGDFIELFNYSAAAVDVSGCSLSDDRDAVKYSFPAATLLPAGGHIAVTAGTLGFGLKAGGDTVYFRAPGVGAVPGRVVDALRFGPQRPGTTYGRSPDGAPVFSVLDGETPGTPNNPPARRDAVISEIGHHPPAGVSEPPFVEITNTSGGALDLGGWRLRGGISHDFPSGTILAAGAPLAVTDFSGTLSDGHGERLRLEMPLANRDGADGATIYPVVDEVTYGTGGRWGRWSDGGGSSLELRDLRSDGRLASNWADSDEGDGRGWVTIEHTGVLDNGSGATVDRLHVMLLGAGECLLDNVEVIPAGGGNVVLNGGFESGAAGWIMQGTHDMSGVTSPGFGGGTALHVRAAGRGDLAGNRLSVPLTKPLTTGSTATIRAKVKWRRGHSEILLRLHGGELEATGFILPNGQVPGTPGQMNSRATANAGPAISNVTHRPVLPQGGQPATVYARLADPDGIGLAQLRYRLDPATAVTTVPMASRGAGLYSAEIPGQANGTLAAFTIAAYDRFGAVTTFPNDAPAREGLVRWGDLTPAGNLGVYRLWMTQATRAAWTSRMKNSNTPLDITFVYGNSRIIYNASAQYSGSPWHSGGFTGPTGGPCDYDCTVPEDDRFLGETDFILAGPGTFGDDTSYIREQTIWWMARKLGLPSLHRRFCRVVINGVQRQVVFEDTQQPNGAWIDEYWPGDDGGRLHKAQDWIEYADDGTTFQTTLRAHFTKHPTTGQAHKTAAYRFQWAPRSVEGPVNDWSDFTALVDAFNAGNPATTSADPAFFDALDPLVDQDSWARALAIQRISGNWDSWGWRFGKNMYIYKPPHGPWEMTAWDIDFSFGLVGEAATFNLFDDTQDPLCTKFRNQPDFRRAYWAAYREAVDGPMLGATVNPRIDAMVAGLAANNVPANASQVSTVKSYISGRRAYILGRLNAVYNTTAFGVAGSGTLSDDDGRLTLTGTAPPAVKSLRINGVTYAPQWTDEKTWSLPLTLYASSNILTVEGLDRKGSVTGSVPVTISVTGPPALPPVTFNEWLADNTSASGIADPADGQYEDWFELHNSGDSAVNLSGFFLTDDPTAITQFQVPPGTIIPAGGFLIVWADGEPEQTTLVPGPLHAPFKLNAAGESIRLSTPDGLVVDSVAFGAQSTNVSQGRFVDGAAIAGALTLPTPGGANSLTAVTGLIRDGSGFHLTIQTTSGLSYQLQRSPDLGTWTAVGTAEVATGPSMLLHDPSAAPAPQWFYRVATSR